MDNVIPITKKQHNHRPQLQTILKLQILAHVHSSLKPQMGIFTGASSTTMTMGTPQP